MLTSVAAMYFAPGKFAINVVVWRNGGNSTVDNSCVDSVAMQINTVLDDMAFFKARAALKLGLMPADCTEWSRSRPRRPYAELCPPVDAAAEPSTRCGLTTWTDRIRVFTRYGVLLDNLYAVKDADALFVVPPGDHFMWPAEFVGHKFVVPGVTLPDGSPVTLETLSLSPRVFLIDKFVVDSECEAIIDAAKPLLGESRGFQKGGSVKIEARNSEQAWLSCVDGAGQDVAQRAFVCDIDQRIASLTRIPLMHVQKHSDALQVVHYDPGQHYHAHHDQFDPTLHSTTPGLREGYNRMLTLLWYLNEPDGGGETVFPLTGENKFESERHVDMSSCARGLKVRPRKGAALLWYNVLALGNGHETRLDRSSLHGGCDVTKGEKWASNKWIYNRKWGARDLIDTEMEGQGRTVPVTPPPTYPSEADDDKRASGELKLTFANALDEPARLFWVGSAGPVDMGEVGAHQTRKFNTYAGHKWAAKRGDELMGEWTVSEDDVTATIEDAKKLKTEL